MAATCNVLGLVGPKSSFPCYICETHVDDFVNFKAPFTFRSLRTQNEIVINNGVHPTKLFKNKKVHWGYQNLSLLGNYIPYDKIVIEILHMWLRISGRLFEHLTRDFSQKLLKKVEDLTKKSKKGNNSGQPNIVDAYFCFLHDTCKLKSVKPYAKTDKGKESLHADMRGEEIETFVSKLYYFRTHFDSFPDGAIKYKIWTLFYKIYMKIRYEGYPCSDDIKKDTWKWMELYLRVYPENSISPYMHLFTVHLHEQVKTFKSVQLFCTQGNYNLKICFKKYIFLRAYILKVLKN